jgi:hypothetical protein
VGLRVTSGWFCCYEVLLFGSLRDVWLCVCFKGLAFVFALVFGYGVRNLGEKGSWRLRFVYAALVVAGLFRLLCGAVMRTELARIVLMQLKNAVVFAVVNALLP